jgi:hypothetical protein
MAPDCVRKRKTPRVISPSTRRAPACFGLGIEGFGSGRVSAFADLRFPLMVTVFTKSSRASFFCHSTVAILWQKLLRWQ